VLLPRRAQGATQQQMTHEDKEQGRMSIDERTFVVVGGGLAAAKTAEALRDQGFTGRVVLVSDEGELPYERPALSKGYLQGKAERDTLFVHPADWYGEHGVELRLGVAATALDVTRRQVTLADGATVGYDKLVLATGAEPRRLGVPGATLAGVLHLRDVGDSDRVRAALAGTGRVVVVGAGWIGLETAAAARKAGREVTVLDRAELPLLHVMGAELGKVYADLHRANGVDLRLGVTVTELTGADGAVTGVRLADGTHVEAATVVVGVGAAPRTALAEAAGLKVDGGIVVDQHLRTSDPDVLAVGDVASAFNPLIGETVRVEHWANALNQPKVAAASMLGKDAVYDRVPYFYSDQFDMGMEYSGHVADGRYDAVVFRGDVGKGEYVAFWLGEDDRVLAGMNVNVWDVTSDVQDLVGSGRAVDRARLADTSVPLSSL
jgi:3-phenylpropionate/trans-cinnamate dioxygenase ferredoxin reductase subunit